MGIELHLLGCETPKLFNTPTALYSDMGVKTTISELKF
jgi:hypothetical protein